MSVERIIEAHKRKLEMWKLAEKQEEMEADVPEPVPDEYTCPICYEEMAGPDHRPMICVPCGHTICMTCMKSAIKLKPDKCPFCGGKIKGEPAVNYALQNAIEKRVENKTPSCASYADQLAATKARLLCLIDQWNTNRERSKVVKRELGAEQKVLDAITEEMNAIIKQHKEQEELVRKLREEDTTLDGELEKLKEIIDPIMIEKQKLELLVQGTQGEA